MLDEGLYEGSNNMDFNDKPIKNHQEDLLRRSPFSKRLAKGLLEMESTEGCCIGLYGPWGSGKTSVINMVLEELQILTKEMKHPPIVMSFNPWKFSSSEQLLEQFFIMLSDKFCESGREELNAIAQEIKKYAKMVAPFGDVGKLISVFGEVFAKVMQSASGVDENPNIEKKRDEIVQALSKQDAKIIIVIDDIDRLTDAEIRLIIQLVSSVANFPNTTYLLSFDKSVVTQALKNVQGYDGEKYLEKIVQVPISIPEPSRDALTAILTKQLDEIMGAYCHMMFDEDAWIRLLYGFIYKHITNVRDIVRLTNSLKIKCSMVGNDVNFVDMIAITLIETKLPTLYQWIRENKNLLVGGNALDYSFVGKDAKQLAEYYKEKMNSLEKEHSEGYINLLKYLFPFFKARISGYSYNVDKSLRRNMRIGHEDIFDRYFALDINATDITRAEMERALYEMSKEELKLYLRSLNDSERSVTFLNELDATMKDIPKERVGVLVESIAECAHEFKGTTSQGWFNLDAFSLSLYKVRDLIMKLDDERDKVLLLTDLISNCDADTIQFMSHFMNIIELAHGRLAAEGRENGGEKVVEVECLEKMEGILLEKIRTLTESVSLFCLDHVRMVLHLYESLDKKGYDAYLQNQLRDDLNKLIFLSFYVHKWRSASISWEFERGYEPFICEDDIKKAFENSLENKTLWTLKEDIIHQAVAFYYKDELCNAMLGKVDDIDVVKKIEMLKAEGIA